MPHSSVIKTRSVTPNRLEIVRHRMAKGWRVEDLARKARCSKKTIENAEGGNDVYPSTLHKIASALQVEYQKLSLREEDQEVRSESPEPPDKAAELAKGFPQRIEIGLRFAIDFQHFDETSQIIPLLQAIAAKFSFIGPVEVRGCEPGSVVVIIEAMEADVIELILAMQNGKLQKCQLEAIVLFPKHPLPSKDFLSDLLVGDELRSQFPQDDGSYCFINPDFWSSKAKEHLQE